MLRGQNRWPRIVWLSKEVGHFTILNIDRVRCFVKIDLLGPAE